MVADLIPTPEGLMQDWQERLKDHEVRVIMLGNGMETELHLIRCLLEAMCEMITLMLAYLKSQENKGD